MKQSERLTPLKIYLALTLSVLVLWIYIPEIAHFAGAGSLVHAFLFAVGCNHRVFAYLALAWIPFCVAGLIFGYYQAVKHQKFLFFILTTTADLIVSFSIICAKLAVKNTTDLGITLLGFLFRMVYYLWMLYRIHKSKK